MNLWLFVIISSLLTYSNIHAQTEIIFKNGMEFIPHLNDTGITWAGEYPSGNNADCTSTTIISPQDCNTGRDANPLTNSDTDGHAGFSFTKLDAVGVPLIDQTIDYVTTPWTCVKDNVTGLVWEIKTTTASIHNRSYSYRWGGLTAIGHNHPNRQGSYYDEWDTLVEESNSEEFCGFTNWRVPTIAELSSITNKGTPNPAIDINYFPHSFSNGYWSSSPTANNSNFAWYIDFSYAISFSNYRDFSHHVRLVHSRK